MAIVSTTCLIWELLLLLVMVSQHPDLLSKVKPRAFVLLYCNVLAGSHSAKPLYLQYCKILEDCKTVYHSEPFVVLFCSHKVSFELSLQSKPAMVCLPLLYQLHPTCLQQFLIIICCPFRLQTYRW